jgi:hypothetical protein
MLRPAVRQPAHATADGPGVLWSPHRLRGEVCRGGGGGPRAPPARVGHAGGLPLGPDHDRLVPGRSGSGPPP